MMCCDAAHHLQSKWRRGMSSWIPRALAGALVLSFLVSACAQTPPGGVAPTPVPRPPTVDVAKVERGDIQQTLSYTGSVRARSQITVVPKTAGRIQMLTVDVGSAVKVG